METASPESSMPAPNREQTDCVSRILLASRLAGGCRHYEVLGVAMDATAQEVKRAYRRLALLCHPDKHQGSGSAAASEAFKALVGAFEVLSDPAKRRQYDRQEAKSRRQPRCHSNQAGACHNNSASNNNYSDTVRHNMRFYPHCWGRQFQQQQQQQQHCYDYSHFVPSFHAASGGVFWQSAYYPFNHPARFSPQFGGFQTSQPHQQYQQQQQQHQFGSFSYGPTFVFAHQGNNYPFQFV